MEDILLDARYELNLREAYQKGYQEGFAAGYEKGIQDIRNGQITVYQDSELLSLPIDAMGLPKRIINALSQIGCIDIKEVAAMKESRIRVIRNMGPKSMDEVARALHQMGIYHTAWDSFLLSKP